jgi:peptide/nickel transport system ATP-binding protein
MMPDQSRPILDVTDLRVHFPIKRGFFHRTVRTVKAVDGVTFSVRRGETLGIVGESGCGKTTVGRALIRINRPTSGSILFNGADQPAPVELATLHQSAIKPFWRRIRMIFQDPFQSLNPRMTVFEIIAEPLRIQKAISERDMRNRVGTLLRRVGLSPDAMERYPHAFSGGQRQRIGIARALALNPELVIADEAVSALDVSVRVQILNLLKQLQKEEGLTYIFISHDLSVIEYLSNRVAVMYVGRIVELADSTDLFYRPRHPYTEALLSAIPRPYRVQHRERIILKGEVADPGNTPSGCHFHPRCPYAQERCRSDVPALREVAPNQLVSCHFAESLNLKGVQAPTQPSGTH